MKRVMAASARIMLFGLQWGRVSEDAETNFVTCPAYRQSMLLQWGRVPEDAEASGSARRSCGSISFFNGAASRKTRKPANYYFQGGNLDVLQWGRVLGDAETVAFATPASITACEAVFERLDSGVLWGIGVTDDSLP